MQLFNNFPCCSDISQEIHKQKRGKKIVPQNHWEPINLHQKEKEKEREKKKNETTKNKTLLFTNFNLKQDLNPTPHKHLSL